jgi:hypothetical protein
MCFFVSKSKGYSKKKIAIADIVCYKLFPKRKRRGNQYGSFVVSKHRCFEYKLGETYYEDSMKIEIDWYGQKIINFGLHSFSSLTRAIENNWDTDIILKCIIPAGATYYYNPDRSEYVSDYITIGTKTDIIP